jgi:hypothetical protein
LRGQLFTLKKEYDKVKKEEDILENSMNAKLIYKENELKAIKSITNSKISNGGDNIKNKLKI